MHDNVQRLLQNNGVGNTLVRTVYAILPEGTRTARAIEARETAISSHRVKRQINR